MNRFILTRASGATVLRWVAGRKKRLRNKYLHARVLCRIVNGRHGGPLLATDAYGRFGHAGSVKTGLGWRLGCAEFSATVFMAPNEAGEHRRVELENMAEIRRIIRREEIFLYKNLTPLGSRDSEMSEEECCPRKSRRPITHLAGDADQRTVCGMTVIFDGGARRKTMHTTDSPNQFDCPDCLRAYGAMP